MQELNFYKDFGSITVSITGPIDNARTQIRGPVEFIKTLDWDSVYSTAALFASHTDEPCMAIALAIQQKYAAWHGAQVTLAGLK